MGEQIHDAKRLKELQALPLERKVAISQAKILEFLYAQKTCTPIINFSGGKDSSVLLYLARRVEPSLKALYADTGLEYPEIRKFAISTSNVDVIRPEMRFDEVVQTYGWCFPSKEVALAVYYARKGSPWALKYFQGLDTHGKLSPYKERIYKPWAFLVDSPYVISPKCCEIMKERPIEKYESANKAVSIIGTLAEESQRRKNGWIKTGCNSFEKGKEASRPLSFWTEQDILRFIRDFNVPYCQKIYGDIVEEKDKLKVTGEPRTGCIFCPIGCHLDKPNKFQRLKETHPNQYKYVIEQLGLGGFLDEVNVPY